MLSVSVAILMISSVFAKPAAITEEIWAPCFGCECRPCGFTPGFWKHALTVLLGGPGNYQSFEGGPLDGEKLTDDMVDDYIAAINLALGGTSYTAADFLAFMKEPGWSPNRTNTANWFNYVAGYGPF